jgi:L-rhamnonate dehydratase
VKIVDIKVFLSGPNKKGEPPADQQKSNSSWLSRTEIANPMSIHPEFRPYRELWLGMPGRTIVQVIAEDGSYGLGESAGGRASAEIIAQHFKKLLVGRQVHEVERNWDIMWRASMP